MEQNRALLYPRVCSEGQILKDASIFFSYRYIYVIFRSNKKQNQIWSLFSQSLQTRENRKDEISEVSSQDASEKQQGERGKSHRKECVGKPWGGRVPDWIGKQWREDS